MYDYLIVGAGFAGSVMAERLATASSKRVLLIDSRDHLGGNAYDHFNDDGILVHRYGPHIFHTNSKSIFTYLSQFTAWYPYEHRVLSKVGEKLLPFPINLDTLKQLYHVDVDENGMRRILQQFAETRLPVRSSEDLILSRVGRDLYLKFFHGYTKKQWGCEPSELDASVAGRIPIRFNRDSRYFTDLHQYMPKEGYTRLFERMLSHPRIDIALSTSFFSIKNHVQFRRLIFTGRIDEYFDYCLGELPYRSLHFCHETRPGTHTQAAATINYPGNEPHTRSTEFKWITGPTAPVTSVVYEYPSSDGPPYYPIPRPQNRKLLERYRELAQRETNTRFVGRLATYRYLNMDQVVGQALAEYRHISQGQS